MKRIFVASLGEGASDDLVRSLAPLIAVTVLSMQSELLGLLNAMPFLWFLLFAKQIGAAVDRMGPGRALLIGNLLRICIILFLGIGLLAGVMSAVLFLVGMALLGLGDALFNTGRAALLPDIVGRKHVPEAMQRVESASAIARVGSPALVSGLLRLLSQPAVFICGILGYFISAVTFGMLIPKRHTGQATRKRAPNDTKSAWNVRRVLTTRGLSAVVLSNGLANSATMVSAVALIYFALDYVGVEPGNIPLIGVATALGGLVGAVMVTPLRTRFTEVRGKLLAVGLAGLSALITPAAILIPDYGFWVLAAGAFLFSLWFTVSNVLGSGIPALVIEPEQLGRGTAAITVITIGVMPAASLLGGFLVAAVEPLLTLIIATAIVLCAAIPLWMARDWQPPRPDDDSETPGEATAG